MEILEHLKEEIYVTLDQSILLNEKMRLAIREVTYHMKSPEHVRHVLTLLLREKEYIVKYLQQLITLDTTGLTVYKLREQMQRSYVQSLQANEAKDVAADRGVAEETVSKLN